MIKINKANYNFYRDLFILIWEFESKVCELNIDKELSPIHILLKWEIENKPKAIKGLRMALNESLSWVNTIPIKLKKELDQILTLNKYPSLNILISEIKNLPQKIIKKGGIKNVDEYYIIKEVLDDVESDMSNKDRKILNSIFMEFEKKYKEK